MAVRPIILLRQVQIWPDWISTSEKKSLSTLNLKIRAWIVIMHADKRAVVLLTGHLYSQHHKNLDIFVSSVVTDTQLSLRTLSRPVAHPEQKSMVPTYPRARTQTQTHAAPGHITKACWGSGYEAAAPIDVKNQTDGPKLPQENKQYKGNMKPQ